MEKMLVGYTGFVGSNILDKTKFDGIYNSKNIKDAFGKNPEVLYYAGIRAEKYIANKFPDQDLETIKEAIENIKAINPNRLVLISTIDVYSNPNNVDEDYDIDVNNLEAYGKNRLYLENWVKENFSDYLIVRLPGLYGKNIKKNFIYDLINPVPKLLNENKYNELFSKNNTIAQYYNLGDNGFYYCREVNDKQYQDLSLILQEIGFSAMNFTDSEGMFQFYNLAYLAEHIEVALNNNIKIVNLASEPVKIADVYNYIIGETFENRILEKAPYYNFITKHSKLFNGNDGYIFDKEFILKDIKKFVNSQIKNK